MFDAFSESVPARVTTLVALNRPFVVKQNPCRVAGRIECPSAHVRQRIGDHGSIAFDRIRRKVPGSLFPNAKRMRFIGILDGVDTIGRTRGRDESFQFLARYLR